MPREPSVRHEPGADLPDPARNVITAAVFFGSIAVAVVSPFLAEMTWILAAILPGRLAARRPRTR